MRRARYLVFGIILAAFMFASVTTATAAALEAQQPSDAAGLSISRGTKLHDSNGLGAQSLSTFYAGWIYLESHASGGTYSYTKGDSVYVQSYATDANNWGYYRMGTLIWDRATSSYVGGGWTSTYVSYLQTSYIYLPTSALAPSSGRYQVDVVLWDDWYGEIEDVESFELTVVPVYYTISASAGSGGAIDGPSSVAAGESASYAITPSPGYHVTNVLVDGNSIGAATSYTFSSVTANHTISATFAINVYTISAVASSGGAVVGPSSVSWGGTASYTITPSPGYHVTDVLVDGDSIGAATSHTFSNVTTNHTISATFAINTYTVSASAGPGGTISDTSTVSWGGSALYTITPNPDYHVTNVIVDGNPVGAIVNYRFSNVTADHSIAAEFGANDPGTHTLTYAVGENGSIVGQSQQIVSAGGSGVAVTAAPNPGCRFIQWSDGSTANPRTDVNVTASRVVRAVFAVGRASASVTVPSVSPSRPRRGKTATFTAWVSPGVAATTGWSTLRLYRYETKTVRKKVRGRWRRVSVKYWRLRSTITMTSDASGRLTARSKPRYAGKWRAVVTFDGSPYYLPCVSGTRSFTVR